MADIGLYRRHTPECSQAKKGRKARKCQCPVWCDGYINGRRIRESMKTRDWRRAEWKVSRTLTPEAQLQKGNGKPLETAVASYLADCEARSLGASTILSYRNTLDAFVSFSNTNGCFETGQVSVDLISNFRSCRPGKTEKKHLPNCPALRKRAGRRNCD